jgi:hypothetical protein
MADGAPDFAKMVPGFDFLQGLVKNAGSVLPQIGQWVAPTLDPAEIDKRIEELRTVQFWLEQNARMLAATIQALEVQRMTLSTLKTMNVQVADLQESMRMRMPEAAAPAPEAPAAGIVDPTQWWNAITQQFTQLAANALKDGSAEAMQKQAGAMVNQGFEAAGRAFGGGAGAGATKPSAKPSAKSSAKPAAPKAKAASRPARKAAAPRAATKRAR